MTLSILTLNITTLSIKGLFVTLSIATLYYYAECHNLFIVMLNGIMPSVILQSVGV
jgi:hypothetical protein